MSLPYTKNYNVKIFIGEFYKIMKITSKTNNFVKKLFDDDVKITPKLVEIFYEDGVPFLKYFGEIHNGKYIAEINIPKMSLELENIVIQEKKTTLYKEKYNMYSFTHNRRLYTDSPENDISIKTIERVVTKEELENELGYKLVIKEGAK